MLPLCFGAATKFSQLQLDAPKTYIAIARLGQTTTTADAEGEVLRERAVDLPAITPEVLARGGRWKGQKQVWFAFRFEGDDSEVRLDAHHQVEYDAWRWARLDETPGLIIPFKRAA